MTIGSRPLGGPSLGSMPSTATAPTAVLTATLDDVVSTLKGSGRSFAHEYDIYSGGNTSLGYISAHGVEGGLEYDEWTYVYPGGTPFDYMSFVSPYQTPQVDKTPAVQGDQVELSLNLYRLSTTGWEPYAELYLIETDAVGNYLGNHTYVPTISNVDLATGYISHTFTVSHPTTAYVSAGMTIGVGDVTAPASTVVFRIHWNPPTQNRKYDSASTLKIAGAATKTLASATLSSASSLLLSGSTTGTLADVVLSAVVEADILAALDGSLEDVFLASTGAVAVAGSSVSTIGSTSLSSTAALGLSAVSTGSLDGVSGSLVGALSLSGDLSATHADVVLAATGSLSLVGSLDQAVADVSLLAEVRDTGAYVVAALDPVSLVSEAYLPILADLEATLETTLDSAAALPLVAIADNGLEGFGAASTGSIVVEGSVEEQLDGASLSADSTVLVSGTASVTLDEVSGSLVSTIVVAAVHGQTMEGAALSAVATVRTRAVLTGNLAGVVLSSVAHDPLSAVEDRTLAAVSLAAHGYMPLFGQGNGVLEAVWSAAHGFMPLYGQANSSLQSMLLEAHGSKGYVLSPAAMLVDGLPRNRMVLKGGPTLTSSVAA